MKIIDPAKFGVSFSLKQCHNFDIDPRKTLQWLIEEAGFRRFRLMSYWNEHEKQSGQYDFKELGWQVKTIEAADGEISMCLGVKQPRWPESHWPQWAWQLPKTERDLALLAFVEKTVKQFQANPAIISFQLENEAALKGWGKKIEIDRERLKTEYELVKNLTDQPIIMTTSTSWGIPVRQPIPNIVGFSYYHTLYRNGAYHHSAFSPTLHRFRKFLIRLLHKHPVFIHELQLEPWGPEAIWKMSLDEQSKSMSPAQIKTNIGLANRIKAPPVDLWGGEWWYWRLKNHKDPTIWQAVQAAIT